MPLAFAGWQYLQYLNGSREAIPSSYTFANGTGFHTEDYPGPASEPPTFLAKSPGLWARNPLPDHKMIPKHVLNETEFPPPCRDDPTGPTDGLCSGERPFHVSIVDVLQVPADIPPGDYVVGWRWDCEGKGMRPPASWFIFPALPNRTKNSHLAIDPVLTCSFGPVTLQNPIKYGLRAQTSRSRRSRYQERHILASIYGIESYC